MNRSIKCMILCCLVLVGQAFALPLVDSQGEKLPTLAPMLKRVSPAVVNISTFSTHDISENPLLNDPYFRRFFEAPQRPQHPRQRQQSAGSGVIVNASKGIIMTNYHVIKGSDEVRVSLQDGRSYQAKVVGSDPELDIAVLSIEAKDLVEVGFADNSSVEVGDFVVAIGNPFGLGQTVTTGVVSALERSGLGIEGYENFIQTDASINPGNSGGALVNLRGELVGINTAIIAPAGGNVGIGFAIPADMAQASMEQILDTGEVKRGQLGVGIQNITSDLREAFDLKNGEQGVLVTNILEGSAAEKAGLLAGDIILEVDGKKTRSTGQLRHLIGSRKINETVKLKVRRNTETLTIAAMIGEPQTITTANSIHPRLEGATFEASSNGVQVTEVSPNSPAAYSGLREGDIIISANKQKVSDLETFKKAVGSSQSALLLQINRGGGVLFIVIR